MVKLSGRQRVYLSCSIIVFIFWRAAVTSARGDDQVREDFLQKYQTHAAKLRSDYSNIAIRYTETYDLGGDRVQVRECEGKYNLSNFCLTADTKVLDKKNADAPLRRSREVECLNPRYSFTLTPGADNQYMVRHLTFPEAGKLEPLCFLLAPCGDYLRGQTFLEMAKDSTVSFVALTDTVWQGRPMKELKVNYKRQFSNPKRWVDQAPSYYFSPDDEWLCHGMRTATESPNIVYERRYYYRPKSGGRYPDLKSIESWSVDLANPKNLKRKSLVEINQYEHSPPFAEAEFALSAFGLPDPVGMKPAPQHGSRWYLWLISAAVGSLILAVICRRLAKRYRPEIGTVKT